MRAKTGLLGSDSVPKARVFPYRTLHEVNERCIELLVNAARSETTVATIG